MSLPDDAADLAQVTAAALWLVGAAHVSGTLQKAADAIHGWSGGGRGRLIRFGVAQVRGNRVRRATGIQGVSAQGPIATYCGTLLRPLNGPVGAQQNGQGRAMICKSPAKHICRV